MENTIEAAKPCVNTKDEKNQKITESKSYEIFLEN